MHYFIKSSWLPFSWFYHLSWASKAGNKERSLLGVSLECGIIANLPAGIFSHMAHSWHELVFWFLHFWFPFNVASSLPSLQPSHALLSLSRNAKNRATHGQEMIKMTYGGMWEEGVLHRMLQ